MNISKRIKLLVLLASILVIVACSEYKFSESRTNHGSFADSTIIYNDIQKKAINIGIKELEEYFCMHINEKDHEIRLIDKDSFWTVVVSLKNNDQAYGGEIYVDISKDDYEKLSIGVND